METNFYKRRQLTNIVMSRLMGICALICVAMFLVVMFHIVTNGIGALNIDFFTQLPKPYGEEGGGVAQAILGTVYMLIVASLISVPIGVATAIYCVEYNEYKMASIIRFSIMLISSLPSIVVGIFVWALWVSVFGYSGFAGSLALSIIMIPIIERGTEEVLLLIDDSIRESAIDLGIRQWKAIIYVILPSIRPALITIVMQAVARAAGETAPLLLTALGNQFFNFDLSQPTSAIPLQIYNYAVSPYEDWHNKAWGLILILVVLMGTTQVLLRMFTRRNNHAKRD